MGQPAPRQHLKFANAVLPHLVPLLQMALLKQSSDADDVGEEIWNIASASGLCLSLLAQATRDDIVPHVLPFVEHHLNSSDWRHREAATLAFGSILDGPSKKTLAHLVSVAFTVILDHMKDKAAHVRDTAAWTVGRICEVLPEIIDKQALHLMMNAFVSVLEDLPSIASHVCWVSAASALLFLLNPSQRLFCVSGDTQPGGGSRRIESGNLGDVAVLRGHCWCAAEGQRSSGLA